MITELMHAASPRSIAVGTRGWARCLFSAHSGKTEPVGQQGFTHDQPANNLQSGAQSVSFLLPTYRPLCTSYGLSSRCFSPKFDLAPAFKWTRIDPQPHHLSLWAGDNVQHVYCAVRGGQIVTETNGRETGE